MKVPSELPRTAATARSDRGPAQEKLQMSDSDILTRQPQAMNHAPAVSIIIPAYNAAGYIALALASVAAQTFSDYETIVVNDGSPDTPDLERALEPYMNRIVYLTQENAGPGSARNAAIRQARGAYVAMLDSDDVWLPNYLERQMAALRADPALDLIYADALLVGESPLAGRTFMDVEPSRGEVTFESLLRSDCVIITSCVVARRQSLVDAGLFNPNLYYSEDFDLWLRLLRRGRRAAYQTEVLAHHRLHGASLCADGARLLESEIGVFQSWLDEPSLAPETKELIRAQIRHHSANLAIVEGKRKLMARQYAQAREKFAAANNFFNRRKLRWTLLGLRFAPNLLRKFHDLREQNFARKHKLKSQTQIEQYGLSEHVH